MINLKEKILEVGVENCLFLVGMRKVNNLLFISYTSSSDELVTVPAKINESRYKVKEGYKITLESIYPRFGKRHFYRLDLEQMVNDGHAQFFVNGVKE